MAINQAYLFLIFTLNGVLIGLLFDFFRILRKTFKTGNIATYVEDIVFWILSGISIIFFMYKFSNGSLRFFIFLGLCFGIILYMLTLSNIIIKTSVKTISGVIKLIHKIWSIIIIPLKFIYKVIDKIMLRPGYIFCSKIQNFATKKLKKPQFTLKKIKKMEKCAKKPS